MFFLGKTYAERRTIEQQLPHLSYFWVPVSCTNRGSMLYALLDNNSIISSFIPTYCSLGKVAPCHILCYVGATQYAHINAQHVLDDVGNQDRSTFIEGHTLHDIV